MRSAEFLPSDGTGTSTSHYRRSSSATRTHAELFIFRNSRAVCCIRTTITDFAWKRSKHG